MCRYTRYVKKQHLPTCRLPWFTVQIKHLNLQNVFGKPLMDEPLARPSGGEEQAVCMPAWCESTSHGFKYTEMEHEVRIISMQH